MGILGAITKYKLNKTTRKKFILQSAIWVIILIGLIAAKPTYEWLYSHELTESEPLSLFDVIQITALVVVFYIANRTRSKLETVERRVQDLHQELSIRLNKK